MKLNPVIVIPARLAATRLPNKPLAQINGREMLLHVVDRARLAAIAPVYVAAGDKEILDLCKKNNVDVVATDAFLPSGTDRISAALKEIDPQKKFNMVINLQGDLPTIDPKIIQKILLPFELAEEFDISTLVAEIDNEPDKINPNVVKPVLSFIDKEIARALYFSRATVPYGMGALYRHIGIYAYTRTALEKFTSLPPSPLEKREKLEQLRALENGMKIAAVLVDTAPLGVDTLEDLEKARRITRV